MKKVILFIVTLLLFLAPTVYAANGQFIDSKNELTLKINNAYVIYSNQSLPVIVNNRTLLPIRMLSELMGFTVAWKQDQKEVLVTDKDNTIIFPINQSYFYMNDNKITLDAATILRDGTSFVPLRGFAEALGIAIDWNNDLRVVHITNERFLQIPALSHIDEMDNLDEAFVGEIVPVAIKHSVEDQTLRVTIRNHSKDTIKKSQLHRNAYFLVSNDKAWGQGSRGYTASSGATGYNAIDIPPGGEFVDKMDFHFDSFVTITGEIKYILVNYFKTTHSSN